MDSKHPPGGTHVPPATCRNIRYREVEPREVAHDPHCEGCATCDDGFEAVSISPPGTDKAPPLAFCARCPHAGTADCDDCAAREGAPVGVHIPPAQLLAGLGVLDRLEAAARRPRRYFAHLTHTLEQVDGFGWIQSWRTRHGAWTIGYSSFGIVMGRPVRGSGVRS